MSSSDNYTFLHVARYKDSGTKKRIIAGDTDNWLTGFWGGNSGTQFHNGWLVEGDKHGDNWVASIDKHNYYMSNGTVRGQSGNGSYDTTVSIFGSFANSEASDAYLAEVLVYNRPLTTAEISLMDNFLRTKYGI